MADRQSTREQVPQRPEKTAPAAELHTDHGHSIAAWTAVGVILLGALVMSVAVVLGSVWLFVAGAVVVVVGGVLGKVLSAMGFGPHASIDSAVEDSGRGQDTGPGGVQGVR